MSMMLVASASDRLWKHIIHTSFALRGGQCSLKWEHPSDAMVMFVGSPEPLRTGGNELTISSGVEFGKM